MAPQAVGVNQGLPSGLTKINDPRPGEQRIAYCPHLYPLPMDLGSGYEGPARTLTDVSVDAWRTDVERGAGVLGGVPVIIGEFGFDTTLPGVVEYIERVYDEAREMGAGVAYWSSDPGPWGPYLEDGTATALVSTVNKPYPRAVAGTPVEWSASDTSLQLTFRPDPGATAPTEIYLPRQGFPGAVNLEGAKDISWDSQSRLLTVRTPVDAGSVTVTVVSGT